MASKTKNIFNDSLSENMLGYLLWFRSQRPFSYINIRTYALCHYDWICLVAYRDYSLERWHEWTYVYKAILIQWYIVIKVRACEWTRRGAGVGKKWGSRRRFIAYFDPGRRWLTLDVGRDLCPHRHTAHFYPVMVPSPHAATNWAINASAHLEQVKVLWNMAAGTKNKFVSVKVDWFLERLL